MPDDLVTQGAEAILLQMEDEVIVDCQKVARIAQSPVHAAYQELVPAVEDYIEKRNRMECTPEILDAALDRLRTALDKVKGEKDE